MTTETFDTYRLRIYKHLTEKMKPGDKIKISDISTDPEKFISAVKFYMEKGYLQDITFFGPIDGNNPYEFIKRNEPINYKNGNNNRSLLRRR